MENNEASCDRAQQKHTRETPNKRISSDSCSKRYDQCSKREENRASTPISPLRMPDLPHPTPPPMANIMMTSRVGYRRLLGKSTEFRSPILGARSRSIDFDTRQNIQGLGETKYSDMNCIANDDFQQERVKKCDFIQRSQTINTKRQSSKEKIANTVESMSPILTRAYLYHRDCVRNLYGAKTGINRHSAKVTDQLGLSPLPRHKNIENLSEGLEDFIEFPIYSDSQHNLPKNSSKSKETYQIFEEHRNKYFSRDSVLSNELEEVRTLNSELQERYIGESTEDSMGRIWRSRSNSETSPEYYSVFFNEHYISDIDENEELKEFICGHMSPERRLSDQSERNLKKSGLTKNNSDYCTQYQTVSLPCSLKRSSSKKCSKRTSKNPKSNTSAFAVHHVRESGLESELVGNRCQFKAFGNIRVSSASTDDLTLHRVNKSSKELKLSDSVSNSSGVSQSSAPISIPNFYSRNSHQLSQDITSLSNSTATLPILSVNSYNSSSISSIKSSDFCIFVPLVTSSVKKIECRRDFTEKVMKSPLRTVVKLAKIR